MLPNPRSIFISFTVWAFSFLTPTCCHCPVSSAEQVGRSVDATPTEGSDPARNPGVGSDPLGPRCDTLPPLSVSEQVPVAAPNLAPTPTGEDRSGDLSLSKTVRILGTHGVPAAYGGFETAAENVGLHLAAAGWRVVVYCQTEGHGPITTDTWRGLERVLIPVDLPGWRGTSKFDLLSIRHAARHRDVCLTFGYNTAVFNLIQRVKGIPLGDQHGRHRVVAQALGPGPAGDPLRQRTDRLSGREIR